jgi:hypothetical protein
MDNVAAFSWLSGKMAKFDHLNRERQKHKIAAKRQENARFDRGIVLRLMGLENRRIG